MRNNGGQIRKYNTSGRGREISPAACACAEKDNGKKTRFAAHTALRHEETNQVQAVSNDNNQRTQVYINKGHVDYAVSVVVTTLVMFGLLMVFSASYYNASQARYGNDALRFVINQSKTACMGFAGMLLLSHFNYKRLKPFCIWIFALCTALLALVLIFGEEVNGAKRWFSGVPFVGSFQPSEAAKVGLILFLAYIISLKKELFETWSGHIICMFFIGVTTFLVMLGNLSTGIVIFLIGFTIVFIASPYILRFVLFAAAGAGGAAAFIVFGGSWRFERIEAWLNPEYGGDKGDQALQSLYAIGSGGIAGLGPGQSRQKMGILPEPYNDFIFSIITEELGVMGAAFVIIMFAILIWRGIKIAVNATDTFGKLVAAGIIVMVAVQVIINIAVVTNSMPTTGVPLPFISYGGTSLLVTMCSMGILLNISRYSKEKK